MSPHALFTGCVYLHRFTTFYFWFQMKLIRIRDSKFGPALVIETTARSGGYVLGFRVDPAEALKEVHKEVHYLYSCT